MATGRVDVDAKAEVSVAGSEGAALRRPRGVVVLRERLLVVEPGLHVRRVREEVVRRIGAASDVGRRACKAVAAHVPSEPEHLLRLVQQRVYLDVRATPP